MTTDKMTSGIISKRCDHLGRPQSSSYSQRNSLYRLYLRNKLLRVTSGLVRLNGLWVRKENCDDYPEVEPIIIPDGYPVVSDDDRIFTVRTTRHGAWLGTAILNITDSIPRALT
jgi:hypothetical protein